MESVEGFGNFGGEGEGGQRSAGGACLIEELYDIEVGEVSPDRSPLFEMLEKTPLGHIYQAQCKRCSACIIALSRHDVVVEIEDDPEANISIDDCPLREE